jgi:hypothetical protein
MHFMLQNGWFCQFLEEDLKTPLPRKVRFEDPEKIIEMAEKGKRLIFPSGRSNTSELRGLSVRLF